MAFIYKPDQGYWTRMISALSIGAIGLAGAGWLWQQLSIVDNPDIRLYVQATGAIIVVLLVLLGIYWVYGRNRKLVDFFIATEGEMRKVNWSTRREVFGMTWVVISVAIIIAALLFTVDILFSTFFKWVGVLAT